MSKTKPNLEEVTERRKEMFNVTVYQNQYIGPLFSLYKHWHEEIELIYIVKGRLVLNVNGESYVGECGDSFIINSKQIHNIVPYKFDEISSHHAVVWSLDVLKSFNFDVCQYKYIEPIQDGKLIFPTILKKGTSVNEKVKQSILEMVHSQTTKHIGWELCLKVTLFNILCVLITENEMIQEKSDDVSVSHHKYETVKKVVDYIHLNFANKIVISDLGELTNLNSDYLIRLFKECVGQTPIEYVNAYRIEQAAQRLLKTGQTVLDISLACGFENSSYFTKKFKEQKGITPKQFQMRARQC